MGYQHHPSGYGSWYWALNEAASAFSPDSPALHSTICSSPSYTYYYYRGAPINYFPTSPSSPLGPFPRACCCCFCFCRVILQLAQLVAVSHGFGYVHCGHTQ